MQKAAIREKLGTWTIPHAAIQQHTRTMSLPSDSSAPVAGTRVAQLRAGAAEKTPLVAAAAAARETKDYGTTSQPRLERRYPRPTLTQESATVLRSIAERRKPGAPQIWELLRYVKNETTGEWRAVYKMEELRQRKYQRKVLVKTELRQDKDRICFELSQAPSAEFVRIWYGPPSSCPIFCLPRYVVLNTLEANKMAYMITTEDEIASRVPSPDDPIDERTWPLEQNLRFYILQFNGFETERRKLEERERSAIPRFLSDSQPPTPATSPRPSPLLVPDEADEPDSESSDYEATPRDDSDPVAAAAAAADHPGLVILHTSHRRQSTLQ